MKRRSSGISMLETMVAFLVFAISVLALMGVMPAAARHQQSTNMRSQAMFLAQQKMDELLQANNRLSATPVTDYPFATPQEGFRTWWGANDPGGSPALQLVTVEVTWLEQASRANAPLSHTVRLRSLLNP